MVGFVQVTAAKRLERQIQRRAGRLMPSMELPAPPWRPDVEDHLVDIAADVLVLQETLTGSRAWQLDEIGGGFRRDALANAHSIHDRCVEHGLTGTADAVGVVESSLRAWQTLALR